jgi:hypothetical protein
MRAEPARGAAAAAKVRCRCRSNNSYPGKPAELLRHTRTIDPERQGASTKKTRLDAAQDHQSFGKIITVATDKA